MLQSIATLTLGLLLLIKGAEIFISSSIAIGKKFKVSEFFIGLIIVGFGTSLCELIVSIDAVIKESPDLSVGNVIGSNIANILLVTFAAGITSDIKPNKVSLFDLNFHVGSHIIFFLIFIFFYLDKNIGALFIFSFILYLYKSFKKSSSEIKEEITLENDKFTKLSFSNPLKFGFPIIIIAICITLFGADITVDSSISISKTLNISDSFIGLTIIAIGTSLPEIATSIAAAKKNKPNIIVGNIIGSNIYNLFLILGFTSLFESFSYNKEILSKDVTFLLILVILFSFLLFKRITIGKSLSLTCLAIYVTYLVYLYLYNF